MHAETPFTRLENKVWFENSVEYVGKVIDSLS